MKEEEIVYKPVKPPHNTLERFILICEHEIYPDMWAEYIEDSCDELEALLDEITNNIPLSQMNILDRKNGRWVDISHYLEADIDGEIRFKQQLK